MADFTSLKQTIQSYIKQNGNEEITGNILQDVLLAMVSTMGDSAINGLASALQDETTARQNQDATLQGNISAEATARQQADTALGGRIDGLQTAINGINTKLAEGYIYAGIATPSTNPGTPSGKVFYIAVSSGTYTNFSNLTVAQGINILKYNGSSWSKDVVYAIDARPKKNSQNFVTSGGVFDNIGALDVSELNATENPHTLAQYTDLSSALAAIPTDYQKGGMSIKYVQTSDNKYVQYRLMLSEFTAAQFTNTANWQGVDDEPTAGSDNLIKSGGVAVSLFDTLSNNEVKSDVSLKNNQAKFPFGDALLKKTNSAIEYRIRMYGDAGKIVAITTVNLLTGNPIESTGLTTIGDEGYIELNSKRRDFDLKIQVTANSTSAGQYTVIVTKIDKTIQQELSNNVSVDDIKSSCLFSEKGFINAADGTVNTTNPTTVCTNFLAIDSGHYIKVYGLSGTVAALVAFYDNNKTFISALNGTSLNNTPLFIESSDIPANAAFIRVSGTVNQLNIANTRTPMEYPFNFKDSSLFTVEKKFVRYPDGKLSGNPYFKCTDFIEYNGKGLMLNGAANDGNIALVAFYDASKTFISAIRGTEKNETDVILMPYQIPSNTKYFKVSCNINQDGNILNGENLSDLVSRVNDKDKNNKIAYQFTGADYDVSRLNVQESFALKDTLGIYADYDALVSSYPDYVSKIDCDAIMQTIGVERPSALDNIPMYMYKFEPQYAQVGVNHDGGVAIRPIKMFICTGTHDEPYAIQTAYNLLEKLCTSWNTDVNLEALRFNATIWVMPVGNPWAMMQPGRGGGGNIRVNYDGVDLNRNMDTSVWVAGTPGTRTYGGPEPNSEYESKVLAHMLASVLPDIFIDFHNFGIDFVGNMIYYGSYDNRVKNIASELTSKMTRVLKKGNIDYVQDTTTILGWIDTAIQSTRGFYAYEQNVPLSLTMEVAAGSPWDNGVLTSRVVSSGTPTLMSENVQIFAYTLLRLAYNLTIE